MIARRSAGAGRRNGGVREELHQRRRVLGRGRDALRLGFSGRGLLAGDRGGRDDAERAGHGRLHDAGRVRGADGTPARNVDGDRERRDFGPLPQRSRDGDRQYTGGSRRRRSAGRSDDQRHRRAGREHALEEVVMALSTRGDQFGGAYQHPAKSGWCRRAGWSAR